MARVFWDTNLYIYLFEGQDPFLALARSLRTRMLLRGDELFTSTMTLGEVQVGPRRSGNLTLASSLRDAVQQSSHVISFDAAAANVYAVLREDRSIAPPDAIQLSCAASAGVDVFITNDQQLQRLRVQGIGLITMLATAP